MKILITGGSGLLGQYLNMILSKDYEILTLYNSNVGNCNKFKSAKTDITDFANLNNIFDSFNPDIAIHTAGFTRPETCTEENKTDVYNTNVTATRVISQLCDKHNAKLIFTSTDLVYDGTGSGMLKETDCVNPVSIYAETKLNAEGEIEKAFGNYIILRTSLMIGFGLNHSRNNFHEMYKALKEGRKSRLFIDQYRTPISLINASEIISEFVKSEIKGELLNFGGMERVSRVELGELLCETAGFDKNLIEKIKMSDIQGFPAVPDVSLNTDKLRSFGIKQKSLAESVREILKMKYR